MSLGTIIFYNPTVEELLETTNQLYIANLYKSTLGDQQQSSATVRQCGSAGPSREQDGDMSASFQHVRLGERNSGG